MLNYVQFSDKSLIIMHLGARGLVYMMASTLMTWIYVRISKNYGNDERNSYCSS